jgi:microcystin-dependent protein
VGTVIAYAGDNSTTIEADGWMLCDGRALDRHTHAPLFGAIQVKHGAGDGVNTFNIPDYRGLFLRGVDAGVGRDPDSASRGQMAAGGVSGDSAGSVQSDMFASHNHANHSSENPTGAILATPREFLAGGNINQGSITTAILPSGGNETRPKNAYVNYLIRVVP